MLVDVANHLVARTEVECMIASLPSAQRLPTSHECVICCEELGDEADVREDFYKPWTKSFKCIDPTILYRP